VAKGSSSRSGPPPDPNALRRDRAGDAGTWTTLPAEGRAGDPPPFPLAEQSEREKALWVAEWKRPQAVEWERNGQELEVALYARAIAAAELHDASVASRTLVRQMQESLGVSLPGLARNRWRIGATGATQPTQRPTGTQGQRRSGQTARERLSVLDGGRSA